MSQSYVRLGQVLLLLLLFLEELRVRKSHFQATTTLENLTQGESRVYYKGPFHKYAHLNGPPPPTPCPDFLWHASGIYSTQQHFAAWGELKFTLRHAHEM